MVDDVEKHWHDPGLFRRVVLYSVCVLAAAALVFAVIAEWAARREPCARAERTFCDTAAQAVILGGPGLVLVAGTVGAFIATYRVWRRGRAWPIWQGAGWFLLTVTLAYLAIGAGTVAA
ncbi:hypothetical protein NDR87_02585 [Nocardia sp. CDC159]|uniref:Uncharacterized protein n=1 Tax=Nocardia pulmonis TaxID=2951408 RepID=A0A9X2E1Y2_9NOCA|nr:MULTISPECIES: hypothetical protein [Nocardia]MCM6772101.1 hypothetical protein [Nocardia pulmonis]MCM6785241.1 hypothetical protein [Nocardia sp. CDC159]